MTQDNDRLQGEESFCTKAKSLLISTYLLHVTSPAF